MDRKFSNKLKELRAEQNLSYKALSLKVGISTAQLCRWENGESDITSDNLIKLAEYFNCTIDYLVGREE